MADKLINRLWSKKPVSDEGDALDELGNRQGIVIGQAEKKVIAPDIDTARVNPTDDSSVKGPDADLTEQQKPLPAPSWVHDQVYGDKVSIRLSTPHSSIPMEKMMSSILGHSAQSDHVQCSADGS